MIAVIDYGASNTRSVVRGLERAGASVEVTGDPGRLAAADGLVLPGVGAAGSAMTALSARDLVEPLHAAIDRGVPFLGVCLGMQLLFKWLEEDNTPGLGVLPGTVRRLRSQTVPHMGWNTVESDAAGPPFLTTTAQPAYAYFAHSYCLPQLNAPDVRVATTDAGERFVSLVSRDTLWGTQFHPEKSGSFGARILREFVALTTTGQVTS